MNHTKNQILRPLEKKYRISKSYEGRLVTSVAGFVVVGWVVTIAVVSWVVTIAVVIWVVTTVVVSLLVTIVVVSWVVTIVVYVVTWLEIQIKRMQ